MAGFETGSGGRKYQPTVSRCTPSSRAILCADQPLAARVAMECCRLTLSWFIAHPCGLGRTVRNPTLKVAGFHLPLPGRF
jgi:hypothetical protein